MVYRVPRTLLWLVLERFGVPSKIVRLLKALHKTVNIKFLVDDVEVVMPSIIGVKQGDLLGPTLFTFHIAAIMMAWKMQYDGPSCVFRTKMDSKTHGRRWNTGGIAGKECSEFNMEDSEYADDTGLEFCSRGDVAEYAPKVNQHFRDWGMEVHEKKPGDTKIKTMVLMCSAPPSEYDDPETMDCADLSDIVLPNGNVIPVVHKARYLGSIMSRDFKDDKDVDHRLRREH